jgi:hypothetical protein
LDAFITNTPPSAMKKSDIEPSSGQYIGCGT